MPTQQILPTRYAEDLVVGEVHRLGCHRVTEQEVVEFATQWDPQLFHTDKAVARRGFFSGLIASGIHTLGMYQRLVVDEVFCHWHVVAAAGFTQVGFRRPVRPGDRITGELTVAGIDPRRPDRSLVTTSTLMTNQDEKVVLSVTLEAYVHRRPGGQAVTGSQ